MNRFRHLTVSLLACMAGLICVSSAQADIVLSGTRIIYKEGKKDTTIRLENKGLRPLLVQNWLDDGRENIDPSTLNVPFSTTPPVSRIDPKRGQTIKIIYNASATLPKDRESVYWFNVLEIPPKMKAEEEKDKNVLQLAFRTRIKFFYRPQGLPGNAGEAPKQLTWRQGKPATLHMTNPTAFYVSLSLIEVTVKGKKYNTDAVMIPPKGDADIHINNFTGDLSGAAIHYAAISDFGGVIEGNARI